MHDFILIQAIFYLNISAYFLTVNNFTVLQLLRDNLFK